MASFYRILSAYSESGDDLQIPVHWSFDSVSDLSVVVVGPDGKAASCDYWTWNSLLGQVEIENIKNYAPWGAYVSRAEDASTLLQLVEGLVVNAQNVVEQFRKTDRIVEALQENSKTCLRAPDYINGLLPNAQGRKNKFLAFDENGTPSCDIGTGELDEAKESTSQAMQAAQLAQGKAELAQAKAELAQTKAETAQASGENSAVAAGKSEAKVKQMLDDFAEGVGEIKFKVVDKNGDFNGEYAVVRMVKKNGIYALSIKEAAE